VSSLALLWSLVALALIGGCGKPTRADGLPAPISLDTGWQLQDTARVTAGGGEVSRVGFRPGGWYAATVPGTVLTSLVNDGVYPEPLYGLNSRPGVIPDSLCRTSYWYRRTFALPQGRDGRRVWLNFQGINYIAEVWVNGVHVGQIQGEFARGIFDITPDVSAHGPNAVAVQILPPTQPGIPTPQTLGKGYGPNGGVLEGNTPTFIDAIGWDWMPGIADRDMGLWQGVSLSASGQVTIQDPYVTSALTLGTPNRADLTVQATLKNATDRAQTGVLQGTLAGKTFSRTVTLPGGATQTVTLAGPSVAALHLTDPKLWWPNGYGPHSLYTMRLTFTVGGTPSDTQDVTFGVRSITYGIANGSGNLGLTVNGVPIMVRGGDWGMDEALKRSPNSRLEAQIRLNAQAGFTMIRNWCGQTTQEEFYRLCDRYGLLVWDEFWLDDTVHYGIEKQRDMFIANAREKLLRCRSHPCVALWCEKNEFPIGPPFEADLRAAAEELDPQRWLQACSSSGHGVGDGHYGIEPVENYFKPFSDPFHTEMGAPSIPTLESIHGMMPPSDWDTFNDDWTEHDMCQFNFFPALTARYGPIADTADFVRKAQLADYETYRAIFEGRNAHLLAPYTGIMIWTSNPAQPSMVWQIYSYDLEPDSSYFGTKHACEMVHVQMTPEGHVQIINNSTGRLSGLKVRAAIYNLDGTRAGDQTWTVEAAPTAATDAGDIRWPAALSPVHFVRLTLRTSPGGQVSDNFYWHSLPTVSGDCSALQTLPRVALTVRATRHDAAGQCCLQAVISNPTHAVALLAHLQLRRTKDGARVLPVTYSDNYVSLLPDETRTVTVEAALTDLHGDTPTLAVDGWNVTAQAWHGSGVAAGPNPAVGIAHAAVVSGIKCGVGWMPGFAADCDVQGGSVSASDEMVEAQGVPQAAPATLYRSERHGDCTYTVPATPARSHTIVLHFAETFYTGPGQRVFDVSINGLLVLSDFDIFAAAGGRDRAVVKTFHGVKADAHGNIVIHLISSCTEIGYI
jgi:hypothetical protein